jgi:hypothetical protein
MYTTFRISNFRCFHDLTLNQLERVNLITGLNNIGKTALLEALYLHCGAYNPELALKINAFRGMEKIKIELGKWVESPLDSMFYQFDVTNDIVLEGENMEIGGRILRFKVLRDPSDLARIQDLVPYSVGDATKVQSASEIAKVLELEYQERDRQGSSYLIFDSKGIHSTPIQPSPPFPAYFQTARMHGSAEEDAELFGKLEVQGKQDILLEVLRLIEPRLQRVAMVVVGGEPMLHGDLGMQRLIPLPVMGGGIVRLTRLSLYIGNAPKGVVLVDEVENGIHYSVMDKVWKAIGEAARRFDAQVFATTHSRECIVAAHKAFTENGSYDFRLHRLEKVNKAISVITYDQKSLAAAIDTGLEVR